MTHVQIIAPRGMFGGSAGDDPIEMALRVIGVGFGDEGGWNAKYGADYENDAFLMKRFCWCESEDCPWCAGCGAFEDTCAACSSHPHEETCFREVTYSQRQAWKASNPKATFDQEMRAGDRINSAERLLRGLPVEPYQWLCDCGAEDALKADRAKRGCDYHRGAGMFARFAPWAHGAAGGYYDPPNFWFKPDNFRVTWYKYIGRDMKANASVISADFMERIFATHPRGMTVADAIAETARQEEETAKSFSEIFARFGVRA